MNSISAIAEDASRSEPLGFGKKPLPPPPPPMAPDVADYFDTNSALIAILASLLILYPPKIQGKLLLWVVGGYGGWQLAVANGFFPRSSKYEAS